MGTRSNIRVEGGTFKLWMYRHWDGYPSGNGRDLCRHLGRPGREPWRSYDAAFRAAEFSNRLMWDLDKPSEYRTKPRELKKYEITTDRHGDIEWLYRVRYGTKGTTVEAFACVWDGGEETDKPRYSGDVAGFRRFVAGEIRDERKRRDERKQRHAAFMRNSAA